MPLKNRITMNARTLSTSPIAAVVAAERASADRKIVRLSPGNIAVSRPEAAASAPTM